jgi:hypothetical protein
MNFNKLFEYLKSIGLPSDQFVVVGSGSLAYRGIRDVNDLDVIVAEDLWNELIKKYTVVLENDVERVRFELDVEVLNPKQSMYGNSTVVSLADIFENADIFEDVKFINLEHLKKIKTYLGREKDLRDVEMIDKYLQDASLV